MRIYNQPISNHPSQTWLKEIADQEHEHDASPASVYSSAAPTLVKIERASASEAVAALDSCRTSGHLEGLAGQVLSPYAQLRILQENT